ncbi:SDR family NAD(P)-dependent oxidoreductase [Comamonadaceae bacterium G21597-S1]|nr:SDR family NAD(P)-dependent oxidoreductase [Comamonadaceae bacterium G21597-S1]
MTGAARGIGRAIAEQLAHDGLQVVATDIDAAAVAATVDECRTQGLDMSGEALDVGSRAAAQALFARIGPVDVVVNNAGIASPMLGFRDIDPAAWRRLFRVNLSGAFIVAQEAVRHMASGARIVNIASRGYLGGAGASHYVASKAAVVGLTRAMAIELRWSGITVNAVAPGMVDTRMLDDFTVPMRRSLENREPSGAAAHPQTIADAVAFLCSGQAAQINGQVLLVDGGKSVGMPPL